MNFYYDDDKTTGLRSIGSMELGVEAYSFDILALWVDPETGTFYAARSSGCSCPEPFEEYDTVESLDNLGTNPHEVVRYIRSVHSAYEKPDRLISAVMNYK